MLISSSLLRAFALMPALALAGGMALAQSSNGGSPSTAGGGGGAPSSGGGGGSALSLGGGGGSVQGSPGNPGGGPGDSPGFGRAGDGVLLAPTPGLPTPPILAGPQLGPRLVPPGNVGPPLRVSPTAPPSRASTLAAPQPPVVFRSIRDAFQAGIRGYNLGDKSAAVQALSFAAEQGHAAANWKLGRMYASGDGVPADPLRAFEYFQAIADRHADDAPGSPNAPFVASAFVALADFHLRGIANSQIRPNPGRAQQLYNYAAVYFGDPDAQFGLARLFMNGVGVPSDKMQAARWLNLASEKCHKPAQALLGHMLFSGDGVPRQTVRGLALLAVARDGVDEAASAWVVDLHDDAFRAARDRDRAAAATFRREMRCAR